MNIESFYVSDKDNSCMVMIDKKSYFFIRNISQLKRFDIKINPFKRYKSGKHLSDIPNFLHKKLLKEMGIYCPISYQIDDIIEIGKTYAMKSTARTILNNFKSDDLISDEEYDHHLKSIDMDNAGKFINTWLL